jgi:hypothetical protein
MFRTLRGGTALAPPHSVNSVYSAHYDVPNNSRLSLVLDTLIKPIIVETSTVSNIMSRRKEGVV